MSITQKQLNEQLAFLENELSISEARTLSLKEQIDLWSRIRVMTPPIKKIEPVKVTTIHKKKRGRPKMLKD